MNQPIHAYKLQWQEENNLRLHILESNDYYALLMCQRLLVKDDKAVCVELWDMGFNSPIRIL
jgi:hypothetical protein